MSHATLLDTLRERKDSVTPVVKEYLTTGAAELRKEHLAGVGGEAICRAYTVLVDDLIKALFTFKREELGCDEPVALVALGGYGRGELNFHSDIDLTLLYKRKISKPVQELTQQILYVLWDTGLDLGFSIRTVNECIALARDDHKTMTALIETRFLLGDGSLYTALVDSVRKNLFGRKRAMPFINEKLDESRKRHEKYGGSVYILEPNVKEGEGGLRDLHTAMWVVKARNSRNSTDLAGLVSESDREVIKGSLDFLLWVRNELHYHTGRKNDQLTFDHQERIARLRGFTNTGDGIAVEAFMREYYLHASNIFHHANMILSRVLHKEEQNSFNWPRKRVRIDRNYSIVGGALTAMDSSIVDDPAAIIKAFEYVESFDVEMSQTTKDLILKFLENALEGFRESEEVAATFIKILKGHNVFKALSEMHNLKFLERYIPEFAEINCRVQHDLYHIYTVDTHTIFAIRELDRLRGSSKCDFPLLATIFEELPNQEIIMLAVLLHDTGKALGSGHAEKGAQIIPEICRRLHLGEDDTGLLKFLVRNHLLLADTAQYRDLHDEKLIIEFARKVGDIERLNLLYLLTFADVRAVGPEVWTQWKGALFQELYFNSLTVLERGTFEAEDGVAKLERIKQRVSEILAPKAIDTATVDEFFGLLPQRYFLSNSPDVIAEHMLILRDFPGKPYIMTTRQDTVREYTEIVVCTTDVHGLFSMITGVMAANAVNILGAQINTLKNGIVLDILQVNSAFGEFITDPARLAKIEKDLAGVLTGRIKVSRLVGKRKPSILDMKPRPGVKTSVQIDNEVSDDYTVLDIHTLNRIGLLYDITRTLTELGLYIDVAKISTKGEQAADIFYIKDIFGQKVFYKEKLREVTERLQSLLSEGQAHGASS
ncbi:MAG: [protein-PII] uridylyltransferase [Thermodesulfobacteriota bacterium]